MKFTSLVFITAALVCSPAHAYYEMTPRGWVNSNCPCNMCVTHFAAKSTTQLVRQPIHQSTPVEAVDVFIEEAGLSDRDVVYDLGCGDGVVVERCVRRTQCRAVGIEISHDVATETRNRLRREGFHPSRLRIVTGDARNYVLTGATVVYVFQWSPLLEELLAACPAGVEVWSYAHPFRGRAQRRVVRGRHVFFVASPIGQREL